jgi:hypothetical protein
VVLDVLSQFSLRVKVILETARIQLLIFNQGANVAIAYLPEEQQDADVTKAAVEKEGRKAILIPGDVR